LKVERQVMLGLRAKDPETRQRFFQLYNELLTRTLFARLQFIIQTQDWEAVSDEFWLKQGLDLILALLVEEEPINLAPNSARVPPLMPHGMMQDQGPMMQPQVGASTDGSDGSDGGVPITFESLTAKHAQFLTEMSRLLVSFSFPLIRKSKGNI
jgi:transformation/transcription domain-associated protein